ncbi:hypothetical protein BX600DRAFT_513955 [Xylariales sp. PMI_506]|nr:hypothetical protein BX600DRAFT_513955 [Xylariales sp. PMI_506]
MAPLLDLPPELFRTIITTTVQELGMRESLKLRQVNKLFEVETMRAYETLLVFHPDLRYTCRDFKGRHNHEYGAAVIPFIARFLSRRPHTNEAEFWNIYSATYARGCAPAKVAVYWQLNISTFLHRILDELQFPEEDRYEPLRVLCEHIDDCKAFEAAEPGVPGVVDVLRGFKPLYWKSLEEYVLPAAIFMKVNSVYEPLLAAEEARPKPVKQERGGFFGSPLYAAVKSSQYDLVRHLLHIYDRDEEWGSCFPLEGAVKTGDLKMVEVLLSVEPESDGSRGSADAASRVDRLSLDDSSKYPIKPPSELELRAGFVRTARLNNIVIAKRLLEYIEATHPGFERSHLLEAMYYAVLYGHIDFMQLLVDRGVKLSERRPVPENSPSPIELACWRGNEETVKWILSRQSGPFGAPTMLAAIIGRNLSVLKLLVAAEERFMSEDEWLTVIWYGIRLRSYAAVSYLLEEAKVLDVKAAFKSSPTKYGTLLEVSSTEAHPEALEILLRAGMPADEKLQQGNNGINEEWTPMMFAHASNNPGAREVEEILERRGIKRRDMLTQPGKELFESGYYPKTMPGIESEMPVCNNIREINPFWAKSEQDAIKITYVSTAS